MRRLGVSVDWETEIATSDPEYYRWTQWLFLRLFERGLAERREAAVNWCPVRPDRAGQRAGHRRPLRALRAEVELRQLTQWFFRITDYAQRLLDDMDELIDWPERVLTQQRNWIGRSEGARVIFRVSRTATRRSRSSRPAPTRSSAPPSSSSRPSTRRSRTWSRAAPRRPPSATTPPPRRARRAADRGDAERAQDRRLHRPLRGQPGQRRAPPGLGGRLRADGLRDRRDHGGARPRRARLRVRAGPRPAGARASSRRRASDADAPLEEAVRRPRAAGELGFLDGLAVDEATRAVQPRGCSERGLGEATVGYRLRDWLISRQRYWGAPIPVIHCPEHGVVPVPDEDLPVLLPPVDDYAPEGAEPAGGRRRVRRGRVPESAAARRGARRTRWTRSSTRPGTSCATPRPT